MKTPEAIKILTGMAAAEREEQRLQRKFNPKMARQRGKRAAALELILANHTDLWKRLDADSGMLDYVTFAPAAGIEITKQDRQNVKQQLKVTKHVLQLTKA